MSSAILGAGSRSEDGRIKLQGEMMVPSSGGKHTDLVNATWVMELNPTSSGAMSFNINVQLHEDPSETSHSSFEGVRFPIPRRPGGASEVYKFPSAEVSVNWRLAEGEQLVGAGEQFSMVGLRGQNFNIWTAEQGIGRGRQPITASLDVVSYPCGGDAFSSYSAVAALLSTRGYGIALDNSQLIRVDLGVTQPAVATMTVVFQETMGKVSGHIWGGNGADVRSLLPGLTDITGRMGQPPAWMQEGLIVGTEGGQEVVQATIDALVAAKVPVAGVWIQDWAGRVVTKQGSFNWWNWEIDESEYSKDWYRKQAAAGIKVLTYINPFLTNLNQSDGRIAKLFLEADRLGHLVKDATGKSIVQKVNFANFHFGMVDVFNPETRKWWTNIIRCNVMMACEGDGVPLVHAWMHDYGEYLTFDAKSRRAGALPNEKGSDIHNLFPRYSAEAALMAAEGFPDVSFFARSGDLRSPGVAKIFWAGDQLTTFDACDGMQSALIGIMTGGLSGWTVNHADIGAFTMINRAQWLPIDIHFKRSAELNVRWLEVSVFINAIYRSHPGLIPNSSSQLWDPDMLTYTKTMTELFVDLGPYRRSLFVEAESHGLPLVRHGMLVEPNDPTWFNASVDHTVDGHCQMGNEIGLFQFYFGDDVIVAPVMRPGVVAVHAYIPQGEWVYFWSNSAFNQTVHGPSYDSWAAPLGQPVFFYRASSKWATFFRQLSKKYNPRTSGPAATFV